MIYNKKINNVIKRIFILKNCKKTIRMKVEKIIDISYS